MKNKLKTKLTRKFNLCYARKQTELKHNCERIKRQGEETKKPRNKEQDEQLEILRSHDGYTCG